MCLEFSSTSFWCTDDAIASSDGVHVAVISPNEVPRRWHRLQWNQHKG